MLVKRSTVVTLVALTLACGGEDRPVLKVGTDLTSYTRETIPSTATSPIALVPYNTWNRGSATAFIPACGVHLSAIVERLVGGHWEMYSSALCIDIMLQTPIELRAGASRQEQVAIGDAGHFRIRIPYRAGASANSSFYAVSREFDVQ